MENNHSEAKDEAPNSGRILVKKCHCCGEVQETLQEPSRCTMCKKSFLPSNYFGKVHAKNSQEFGELFSKVIELHEEDMIKGLSVIW